MENQVKKNTVTKDCIDALLKDADITVSTAFDKCTVVTVRLKNGFVITESSACVDAANYDAEMGKKICMQRIEDKLWAFEGYTLQKVLYAKEQQAKKTAKERVVDELKDLQGRIERLCKFMFSDEMSAIHRGVVPTKTGFNELSLSMQGLMRSQLEFMKEEERILLARLAAWED